MLSVEDSKPAVVGGVAAVGASFAMNPTLSVGLGALLALVTKNRTDPEANFLLVGGLMFVVIGFGGMVLGSFPGGPVAAIGVVGGVIGATFLWLGRKVEQWALGRIARFLWTLINFKATLILILKVAIVLPLTFAAGVFGADVPIIGDFAFVLYCFAVLAGFYVLDQGKSIFQVRKKIRGTGESANGDDVTKAEDVTDATATAEAAAQKAEKVAANVRDADQKDVKEAASTAKETVSSMRSGADDDTSAANDSSESTASKTSEAVSDSPDVSAEDESATDRKADEETTSNATASDSESVSTDWLAEPSSEPSLLVRNVAPDPKSVRVGCRVSGEKRLADDVRLNAGEAADWDDLPTESQFEIGIVVDSGPSGGKRFDPVEDRPGEIQVVITDERIEFGDGGGARSSERETTAGETRGLEDHAATDDTDGEATDDTDGEATDDTDGEATDDTDGEAGDGTSNAPAGSPSEPASAGGSSSNSSSAANKVFGETTADSNSENDGSETLDESKQSAAELADAVRQSPTEKQVIELATFLDAEMPSEREVAITGLRQSVREHPESVVPVVPSVAALLRDDAEQTRQEAIVTLQRLAKTNPSAVADVTDSVVNCLDDESAKVRTAACRTLDEIEASAGGEKLRKLADEDPHKGVQVAAYHALQSVQH